MPWLSRDALYELFAQDGQERCHHGIILGRIGHACDACAEADNDRFIARYYGSGHPVTDDERVYAAMLERRDWERRR